MATGHFIEQETKSENIRARVEVIAAYLLRRHVRGSATDDADKGDGFLGLVGG